MACSSLSLATGADHGEAAIGGHECRRACQGAGNSGSERRGSAPRASGAVARAARCNAGANRSRLGRRPCHRRPIPSQGASAALASRGTEAAVGWSPPSGHEPGGGAGVSPTLGRVVGRWQHVGRRSASCGACAAAGPTCDAFGCVSAACAPRLAQGGARHPTPQERSSGAGAVEKNSPGCWLPVSGAKKPGVAQSD